MPYVVEPLIYLVAYTVFVSVTALLRHWLFHTYAYDLGIFVQAISTTVRGEGLLYETPDSHIANSYLGVHFSPILLLLVPLAFIFPPAEMLLVLQSILLALPAFFIFNDALEKSRDKWAARALTLMYLLHPALHGINLYDFHTHSILLPLAYFLVKYARKLDTKRYVPVLVALHLVTEHSIVLGLGLLLYLVVKSIMYKRFLLKDIVLVSLILTLMAFISSSVITFFGKPTFHPQNRVVFFEKLGNTWSEVLKNMFSIRLLLAISDRFLRKVGYWLLILSPIFLLSSSLKLVILLRTRRIHLSLPNLPIIAIECIIFFSPWLAITLISSYFPFYTFGWQFNSIALGPIAAYMPTLSVNLRSRARLYTSIALLLAISTIGSPLSPVPIVLGLRHNSVFMGGAYDFNPWFSDFKKEWAMAVEIRYALMQIPSDASVLCTQNIFPHVATRANVYVHRPPTPPDYIVIDDRFFDWWTVDTMSWVRQTLNNETYKIVYRGTTVQLLKRA